MRSRILVLLALLVTSSTLVGDAQADDSIEDYARYQPQSTCHPKPRPGTRALGAYLERTYPRTSASVAGRSCGGGVSEHKDGRAVDWRLDARRKAQRLTARAFLRSLLATDADGNHAALARRMGIMYVIWNDRMYAAYDRFEPRTYLSSSCRTRRVCSKTLRHRDHMHISLSRRGGKGLTSWYVAQPRS